MSGELGQREWKVVDFREGDVEDNPKGSGQLQKFWVDFEGSPDVYWRRKLPATVEKGQTYFGTISEGKYGPMFKKETPSQGGGHSEATVGAGKSGRDLDASIARQVALKVASPLINRYESLSPKARALVNDLEAFILEAGQSAPQGAGVADAAAKAPQGTATTPAPEEPSAEEDLHRLDDALCDASVTDYDERRWISKAWGEMDKERQQKALAGLVDIERQGGALKRLREIAGPMPESFKQPVDELPF